MAVVVFGAWVAAAIFCDRSLYADGAHEFVRVLQAQDFVALMWSRHFAFYTYEFPLVLAIKCGITNLPLLRLAFGLGCFLPWPLALMFCRWISPENFWLAAAGCAAGYLNAAYMAVGEHILAHALFWPPLFVVLFARPLKPLTATILLVSAAGLLFSYESQVFLCLPLAALSLWRIAEESRSQPAFDWRKCWQWAVLLMGAVLFLASSGIGVYALLKPEIPSNYIGFTANAEWMIHHLGWTLAWTIWWGCLLLAVLWSEKTWAFICHRPVLLLLFCALAIWGLWPVLAPGQLDPARQYDNRILDLLVPLLLLLPALSLRYRPAWLQNKTDRLVRLTAVLLMVQSVWQLGATWQWHQDVRQLQSILESQTGVVRLRSTSLFHSSIESRAIEFDWTWPCLSIALNPGPHIRSLVCSELYTDPPQRGARWQPFDPLDLETLPALQHYGLDFDGYKQALRGRPGAEK